MLKKSPAHFGTIALVSVIFGIISAGVLSGATNGQAPSAETKTAALFNRRTLPEPLVPIEAGVSDKDCDRLIAALDAFERRAQSDDFSQLEKFLEANPKSPWRLAVETNLGLLQYRAGYFSRCIASFQAAWEAGKGATDKRSKALADRAAGEYTKMLARLGRHDELKAFLVEVAGREFVGQATELMMAGIEGSKTMELRPEVAFRCGPMALSRILANQNSPLWASPEIVESRATSQGMSLLDVAKLSAKLGLNYQVAKRSPGARLVVPAVIHWKVGHYAALIHEEGGKYMSQDPTFENDTWHSLEALEAEASGYFLIPSGPLPAGWSAVQKEEARQVFGRGVTTGSEPDDTGPEDHDPEPPPCPQANPPPAGQCPLAASPPDSPCPGIGMAVHSFHTMLASLKITDTPLGYKPPYGDFMNFTLVYAQREASQPSNFNYTNAGPKWNLNWISYVIDDPGNYASVSQATSKGGTISYRITVGTGGSSGRYISEAQFKTHKKISRSISTPLPYEVLNPDGSKEIFGQSDGSTVAPRKIFMTGRIDPAGNETTFSYDSLLRITKVTDALGQQTTVFYELAGDPYKITKVTDPFGRSAVLSYDSSNRLIKIRDIIGFESVFAYEGAGDFINSLTTPYGTTTFTNFVDGQTRRVTAADPTGETQVLETSGQNDAIPSSEVAVPAGMSTQNNYLNYRNSFFWNKKQWKEFPGDYSKAHLYHWLHGVNFTLMSGTLESEKPPLQSRIWYNYPGQSSLITPGTSSAPSAIGRVIEGGTQLELRSINSVGKVTATRDPVGRTMIYGYDDAGIDLLRVQSRDQNIIAVNANGPFLERFDSDNGFSSSAAYSYTASIDLAGVVNAAPEGVYQTGRYGSSFSYTSPSLPPGQYAVRFHFSEPAYNEAGRRVFDIQVNGVTVISGLDVFVAAGNRQNRAVVREASITTGTTGPIVISFASTVEYAMVAGIEIISPPPSNPVGPLALYTYNAQHRPLTYTDAAGQVTTYTWNSAGQITSAKNPKNETTTFAYYAADAAGKQHKGRLEKIDGALSGSADVVAFDYDAAGNLGQVTGPDGYNLSFAYDTLDRLTRVTFPDATYAETIYDRLDPLTSRDRLGRITEFTHNSIRQLTSVKDPAQRKVQYDYCNCGDLDELIDPMNRITRWRHDMAGRVTAKMYADGSTIKYDYEPLSGRLSTITDEKGQVKTRTYNLDNTLAGIAYTHAEHPTPNVAFTYDTDFRRLKTMLDGIGTTTYAYNPIAAGTLGAGRLASVDGPLPDDILTYTYDELGRNTGYAINGVGETRSFDPLGRLLTAVNPLGTFGYTYVGATSRMDKITYPNGMTCQYNYHPLTGDFRLQDIIHTLPGNTQLSRHSYEYSAVGDITRWTQISPQAGLRRSWLCGYDDADQLTSVASQDPDTLAGLPTGQYAYTYDPAGNRLTETIDGVTAIASFNALNQLTSLTTEGASTLPQQTYEWDAEDRLSAINYTGTDERTEFEYDGYGRRTEVREIHGTSLASNQRFVWRALQQQEERNASGVVQNRSFSYSAQTLGDGGSLNGRLFSRDHLGSIREVTSSTASTIGIYDFDPWGRRSILTGMTDESKIAFTGHWFHARSSLTMAPYRAYDPNLGRWLSRDPIEELDNVNLYGYVSNQPITFVDFLGLAQCPLPEEPSFWDRFWNKVKNAWQYHPRGPSDSIKEGLGVLGRNPKEALDGARGLGEYYRGDFYKNPEAYWDPPPSSNPKPIPPR